MKLRPFILSIAFATLLLSVAPVINAENPAHAVAAADVSAADALARLKEGNQRFVSSHLTHPHQTAERRTELASGQRPFAIVLGCADSRTSPEVIFDQGLGDVFVLRVAGNVLSDETIGSIEYAVEHLGSHLIVVLGHEKCGAVKAAKETIAAHGEAPGHIQSLVKAIAPAVESTTAGDSEATCKANVANVVKALRNSGPILKNFVDKGTLAVVGAKYHLADGVVEFFDDVKTAAVESSSTSVASVAPAK